MDGELLLTGATGFIGQALLWKWLQHSDLRCNLLVRSRRGTSPVSRVEAALREIGINDPSPWMRRIEVFDADMSQENLSLERHGYERLTKRVTHIVHCAAAARFDLEIEDARRTNVRGVRDLLNFAAKCDGLRKLDYIGTAYVAGRRTGVIREDELDVGQEHRNTYEQSKFEAEKLIREWMTRLPISILRPSIVICDSRTGYASNHNGFYRALRMYLKEGVTMLPGYPGSLLDLVPVDYIADACFAIAGNSATAGQCYHLTAGLNNATMLGEIRELASRFSGKPPFAVIPPPEFLALIGKLQATLPEEKLKPIKEMELFMPYMLCEHQFDNTNAVRDSGIRPPAVREYFSKFVAYILRSD